MALDINYNQTTPRAVSQILEAAIEDLQGASTYPIANTSLAINSSIAALSAQGGGIVILKPGNYTISEPINLVSGVSIIGSMQPVLQHTGYVPDTVNSPLRGAILNVAAGVIGMQFNNVDGTFPVDPNLAATGCGHLTLKNLVFVGGLKHIDTGAFAKMGLMYARVEDIHSYNSIDEAISFDNFQHCVFKNIYVMSQNVGTKGGIYFRCSLDEKLLPGNSTIEGEIYTYTTHRLARSIVFESNGPLSGQGSSNNTGSQLNEVVVTGRLQGNRYGSATPATITISSTNGSANLAVSAGLAELDIGSPVVWATGAPTNFSNNTVYWVYSIVGSNIQLASVPLGTSGISAGSTSNNTTAYCGGYPSLEIHANGNGTFTNCDFGQNADLENYGGIVSASFRRTRTCKIGINENFGSNNSCKTAFAARDAGLTLTFANIANCTTDFDSNCNLSLKHTRGCPAELTNTGGGAVTNLETAVKARHNSELYINSDIPCNYTLDNGTFQGFEMAITQVGTGVVTVVQGTGATVVGRNGLKTAGQNARLVIKPRAQNKYSWIVSGDTTT